jgi:hypothetical protein
MWIALPYFTIYKIQLHATERDDVDCVGCPTLIMKHCVLISQENTVVSHATPKSERVIAGRTDVNNSVMKHTYRLYEL